MPDNLLARLQDRSLQGSSEASNVGIRLGCRYHNREAAAPNRAVLLKTHHPPRIRRVTLSGAGIYGAEDVVSQDEVLAAVAAATDQSLIVLIIGTSGAGKSHWCPGSKPASTTSHRLTGRSSTSLRGTRASPRHRLHLDGGPDPRSTISDGRRKRVAEHDSARSGTEFRDELAVAAAGINAASREPASEPCAATSARIGALLDDPVYAARLPALDDRSAA